jgi:hypothetical protein
MHFAHFYWHTSKSPQTIDLRDPDIRSNPQWKIQCFLQDAETLLLKGLFNLARKTLTKALKLAIECQLPEWQYKIHLAFTEIFIKQSSTRGVGDAMEHLQEAEQTWERVKQSEAFTQLYVHILLQWLQKQFKPDELAAQLDLLNTEIPDQLTFLAKLKYAQSRTMFAQYNNDQEQMVYWQKLAHDLFTNTPELKTHYPDYYLTTYGNYFMAALLSDNKALITELNEDISTLEYHDPFMISRLEGTKLYSRLAYWLSDNEITLSVDLMEIDKLLDQFEDHEKTIPASSREAITFNIGLFYFLRSQTKETLIRWSDSYEVSKANPQRPDRQRLIILLLLLNDYQDSSFDPTALVARVEATRSRLNTWNKEAKGLQEHEKITIRHTRKLANLPPRDEGKELMQLKKFYAELKAYADNSTEPQLHRSKFILQWLEIKIQGFKP